MEECAGRWFHSAGHRKEDARSEPGWRGFSCSWEAAQHLTHQQGGDTAPLAPGAGRDWNFAADGGRFPDVNSQGSNPLMVAAAKGFLVLGLLLLRAD